jgi:eukaryotic-like serine/threonine-protein kinase
VVAFGPMVAPPTASGGYILYGEIASGGMASVHLGRLVGAAGFARTVAIKRLHPHLAADPAFAAMFLDEARLAARIRHANVVSTLDVVSSSGEAFLVLDYVPGESLAQLQRGVADRRDFLPISIACAIVQDTLAGLHAAHEARGDGGEALGIVHRDVSPQNILVGVDGVARLLDFGVAKAERRYQESTQSGVKGKLAYMAPEQVELGHVDRRADVFCAGIVLWELLSGARLFATPEPAATVQRILTATIAPPSASRSEVSSALDAVVLRALERDPEKRFATALEMHTALEHAAQAGSARAVGAWVETTARASLEARAARVAEVEGGAGAATLRVDRTAPLGLPAAAASEAPTEVSVSLAFAPGLAKASAATSPPTESRRGKTAFAVVGSLVLVGVAAAFLALRGARSVETPPAAPSPAATSAAAPPPTSAESEPPASPPSPASAPTTPAEVAATAKLPIRVPRAKSSRCNPNYSIDARGLKHLKPECL